MPWLGLTMAFLFGHYIMGDAWERLLSDYKLFQGRIWVLALIWNTIAPVVFYPLTPQRSAA